MLFNLQPLIQQVQVLNQSQQQIIALLQTQNQLLKEIKDVQTKK